MCFLTTEQLLIDTVFDRHSCSQKVHCWNGITRVQSLIMDGIKKNSYSPQKLRWIPKMMVWKRRLLLNMAMLGIYVKFLGCIHGFKDILGDDAIQIFTDIFEMRLKAK